MHDKVQADEVEDVMMFCMNVVLTGSTHMFASRGWSCQFGIRT